MELARAKKILVCARYGIGDLVMQIPVLESLRAAAPRARITALGARPAIEILENDSRVDELACVQDFGIRHWGDPGDPESRARIRSWLAERDDDVVLDPAHAVRAVREILAEVGGNVRDASAFAQHRTLQAGGDAREAIKAEAEDGWGLRVPAELQPRLDLGEEERAFAGAFLEQHGVRGSPIGVSPLASSRLKQWPPERLARTVDAIADRWGHRFLMFCGPEESIGEELLRRLRRRASVSPVGASHLKKVAALLASCRLLICNDTGLMHLAAAVRVPVLGIFGPTLPRIYLPRSPESVAVAGDQIECSHRKQAWMGPPECVVRDRCLVDEESCIREAPVATVLEAVRRLLNASDRPGRRSPP